MHAGIYVMIDKATALEDRNHCPWGQMSPLCGIQTEKMFAVGDRFELSSMFNNENLSLTIKVSCLWLLPTGGFYRQLSTFSHFADHVQKYS